MSGAMTRQRTDPSSTQNIDNGDLEICEYDLAVARLGLDGVDVYACIIVQAKGRGYCPLNLAMIQETTGLDHRSICSILDTLAKADWIRLGLTVPDQNDGAEATGEAMP